MRRIILILLSFVLLLNGCGMVHEQTGSADTNSSGNSTVKVEELKSKFALEENEPVYKSLDDKELLRHIEDLVYRDTVTKLTSDA